MTVEFRLLGPVEAWDGSEPVRLLEEAGWHGAVRIGAVARAHRHTLGTALVTGARAAVYGPVSGPGEPTSTKD